jgi:hypothetical protein
MVFQWEILMLLNYILTKTAKRAIRIRVPTTTAPMPNQPVLVENAY